MTRGESVIFYTNAFIFDKDIARELHDNPQATINLSIDAGTADTWRKVKGVDNFNHVLDNLIAYRKASARAGQIILKYIIMPGINDSEEDFRAFVDIVKALNARFYFSRDLNKIDMINSKNTFFPEVVEAAARLLAICAFNGLVAETLHGYTGREQQQIKLLAQKIFDYMR